MTHFLKYIFTSLISLNLMVFMRAGYKWLFCKYTCRYLISILYSLKCVWIFMILHYTRNLYDNIAQKSHFALHQGTCYTNITNEEFSINVENEFWWFVDRISKKTRVFLKIHYPQVNVTWNDIFLWTRYVQFVRRKRIKFHLFIRV